MLPRINLRSQSIMHDYLISAHKRAKRSVGKWYFWLQNKIISCLPCKSAERRPSSCQTTAFCTFSSSRSRSESTYGYLNLWKAFALQLPHQAIHILEHWLPKLLDAFISQAIKPFWWTNGCFLQLIGFCLCLGRIRVIPWVEGLIFQKLIIVLLCIIWHELIVVLLKTRLLNGFLLDFIFTLFNLRERHQE